MYTRSFFANLVLPDVTMLSFLTLFLSLSPSFARFSDEFNPVQVKALEEVFRRNLPPDQDQLSLQQFRRLMPTKNVSALRYCFWQSIFFIDLIYS